MHEHLDNGEVELSDKALMPNTDNSASVDLFLDELLKTTRTCTHTHTCNPPGPDVAVHTHTCYHTHTRVIPSEEDHDHDHDHSNDGEHSSLKPRRPKGNREAVRKYREKKKAHTAYLEEEVKKLRLLNQQLVRKLQGQAILEAEVARLRGLLAHLKAKIDDELGIFPFQKQCDTSTVWKEDDCGVLSTGGTIGLRCQSDLPCFDPQAGPSSHADIGGNGKMVASREGNCHPAIIDCQANRHDHIMNADQGQTLDAVEAMVSSASQAE
ncbi:basic leucine zipper 24-like [Pistacia vera]|uniref:basic leucine zipper 24-like n=1 Tax=Pistacia vera TaxID=55513 RepID=UPI001263A9BE|nr:basic leucine zipper 24-like [Pistacia vera]